MAITRYSSPSVAHLAFIRCFVRDLAEAAKVDDPDGFSHQWNLLMKEAAMAAEEGDARAAQYARKLGILCFDTTA